jgi:hypothetical protein
MEIEHEHSLKDRFNSCHFSKLSGDEIVAYTKILTSTGTEIIKPYKKFEFDGFAPQFVNILVTGMPHVGKSTALEIVLLESFSRNVPIRIIAEDPPPIKPDIGSDYDAMLYNFAMATSGLNRLLKDFHPQEDSLINIFERGSFDHIVFAEALNKIYDNVYTEEIEAFKNFYKFFIPLFDGIIICNASSDTSIKNGSSVDHQLLGLLSSGYKKLPDKIAPLLPENMWMPVISIDFDTTYMPVDVLKRSINSMIGWRLNADMPNSK